MKQLMTAVLATGLCISASAQAANPNLQLKPQISPKIQPQIKPGVLKPQGCPDLTIKGVSVYIVRQPTPPDVRLNFMVQLHNNGNLDYRPNPHGMRMNLVLEPTAGGARRIIDTKSLKRSKPGVVGTTSPNTSTGVARRVSTKDCCGNPIHRSRFCNRCQPPQR